MSPTNQVFLLTFLIIATGFAIKKFNVISEKDGKTISRFMMYTTFPALMFSSTSKIKLDPSLFAIPIVCVAVCFVMIIVGWFVFAKYPNQLRGVLMLGFGATNVGFFGFPIVEGLFGKEALKYLIMYDIGNTFCGFFIAYPIGKYFASKSDQQKIWKVIFKKIITLPPLIGMVTGLFVSSIGLQLPIIVYDFMGFLARGNAPIGLLLLGVYLSFNLEKKQIFGIAKVLGIRYFFALATMCGIYYLMPESTMKQVLMLIALMPLGIMILPFSDEMNYDSRIAGALSNASLLISFILMWAKFQL